MMTLDLSNSDLLQTTCFAHGRWLDGGEGGSLAVTDPNSGDVVAAVAMLSRAEVANAIESAARAFREWRKRTAKQRADLLLRWREEIVSNVDDLARLLTAEEGKPLRESRGEILSNAGYLRWFAEEARRVYGDVIPPPAANQRILTLKQPVGVCAAITPWNFPNGMITRKAGPALAAGCTIVVKPADQTPLSALALAECARRAGIPPGVFSVVVGKASDIGHEFCENPKIAKISFTGSTKTGRWLMRESAPQLKHLSLELGGNAPFIVFDDADLDAAVDGSIIAKFRNSGQTCVCANRLYIQEHVYDEFAERLRARVDKLVVGPGTDERSDLGPLINDRAVDKMEEHLSDALERGGHLQTGGHRHARGGTYFEPTLVTEVTQTMRVAHEETFAPLAPLIRFRDEAQVVAMANDTELGLASYFYSRDLGQVWRVAEALETGIVGVNSGLIANETAPFGGVKQSGFGREGSKYGIADYLDIKYVCMGGIST